MKTFLLIATILFSSALFAQKTHVLQGVIGIQGGDLFNYDLTLTATEKANEYKGYVKTYAMKDKEVEANVTVVVHPATQTIELTETEITRNTGFQSKVTICLVRSILKYDPVKGVLAGDIITQTANNDAYCARGKITFTNTQSIKSLLNILESPAAPTTATPVTPPATPVAKPVSKPVPTSKPTGASPTIKPVVSTPPVNPPVQPTVPAIKKITEGKDEVIPWYTDHITIEVWDDNTVDGDIVTVYYNGEIVADQIKITKTPHVISLPFGHSDMNIVAIKAINEGFESPNTAVLRLIDGTKEHKIEARNVAGKMALVRLKKAH